MKSRYSLHDLDLFVEERAFTDLEKAFANPEECIALELRGRLEDNEVELLKTLRKLPYLEALRIVDNHHLTTLPEEVTELINFDVLQFINCSKLEKLPDSLSKSTYLEHLTVRLCPKVQAFPPKMEALTSLEYLEVSMTGVKDLPDDIGAWNKLQTLILGYNQLEEIPVSLLRMTELSFLCLAQEPPLKIPAAIDILDGLHTLIHRDLILDGKSLEELKINMEGTTFFYDPLPEGKDFLAQLMDRFEQYFWEHYYAHMDTVY